YLRKVLSWPRGQVPYAGNGLGISERTVHCGSSWGQNLGDQSARWRCRLPRVAASKRKRRQPQRVGVMAATKVMIVDDEPQARRVLKTALISRGFEITDARSGEEALENLRHETPDVILL